MVYNEYDIGDLVMLDVDITISGVYVDPNHLCLYVTDPTDQVHHYIYGVTGTFVKESTGKYYLNYYVPMSGQYRCIFYASGTAWGAEVKRFVVRRH